MLDHVGDSPSCAIHSTIDGREHIVIRILDFHTSLHAHSDLAACPRAERALFRLGEIDGHAANALPEATQRKTKAELQMRTKSLSHLDAVRSNLNLHLAPYCVPPSTLWP